MKPAWFLLLTAISAAQTAGTDQTGGISGVVTDAVSHLPVKKATISINGMGNIGRNQGGQGAMTDATGTFTIGNLPAGPYRLVFQHQNYPQARFGGVTKSVDVKAGETAGPITVELIPGATVSGHIVDEDGDPLPNCNIQIHPAKNPEQGVPMAGASGSNEDGEYRAYGIAPGKYILAAQCGHQVFQPRPFSSDPEPPPTQAYPMQFYPMTTEAKAAGVVELTPGAEKSGVDFRMRPAAVTQVLGAFSPSGADWHGHTMILQLIRLDQLRRNGFSTGASLDQPKGTFTFRQVFPGSYILVAFSTDADENRIGVTQRIEVQERPVEVVLELHRAIDLSGRVEIEASTTNKASLGQIGIQLFPQFQIGMPAPQTQVGNDGSFTLKGVIPLAWRLQVNGPLVFVKSVWLGSADVTSAPFDLSSGAGGALRIVLSTNMATIRGSAPAGQMIFAQRIDDEMPFRSNRGTQADQSGQYKLEGLAPGKYRLMLTDPGTPIPDEGGQEVTVHEGETIMVDLKAQPAP